MGDLAQEKGLRALSGMAYHGGKDRAHWIALVGVDPAAIKGVEVVKDGDGIERCYWTEEAENAFQAIISMKRGWMAMLTSAM